MVAVLALLGLDGRTGFKTIRWLLRGGKPVSEPAQLVRIETPEEPKAQSRPQYPKHLPPGDPPVLIGRAEEMRRIHDLVGKYANAEITGAVAEGEGGKGKTALAWAYADLYRDDYDGILWIDAETRNEAIECIARMGIEAFGVEEQARRNDQLARSVLNKIRECEGRWLFIYDNADDPEELDGLVDKREGLSVIITSRSVGAWEGVFEPLELAALDTEKRDGPAVQLLLREADAANLSEEEHDAAWQVAIEFGGLPHALNIIGALYKTANLSFTELKNESARILETKGHKEGYRNSVLDAVMLSYARLSEDAKRVADICAWFAPEGITEALFLEPVVSPNWADYEDRMSRELRALVEDTARLRTALGEVRQRSMLGGKKSPFTMHRTTSAALRVRQREGAADFGTARDASALLATVFPFDADHSGEWENCRILEPHGMALWATATPLWEEAWGKPGWAAMGFLLNQMGIYQSSQERLQAAVVSKRASLNLMRARLPEKHGAISVAMVNLANELVELGEVEAAQEMIAAAVALDKEYRAGSGQHAGSLYNQAFIASHAYDQTEYPEQKSILLDEQEEALSSSKEMREGAFGAKSIEMARWWSSWGMLQKRRGNVQAVLEARARAYQISKGYWEKDGNGFAARAMNLGCALLEQGHAEQGLRFLQEALETRRAIFAADPKNAAVVRAADWLESCHRALALKGVDAEAHLAKAEALCVEFGFDPGARARIANTYPLEPQVELPDAVEELL